MSKKFKFILLKKVLAVIVLFNASAFAENGKMVPIKAPDEPEAIVLNTGGVKGQTLKESWFRQWGDPMARNITVATLTPVLADPKKATGTSVIVAPGGGFMWLSMNNEGWEVAKALADRGINAFVLKYRLQPTAEKLSDFEKQMKQLFADAAKNTSDNKAKNGPQWDLTNQLEDVQAAYNMLLDRSDQWGVNKDKIGMIGFSAGAALTMATALKLDKVKLSFIGQLYGGMNAVEVPKNAPALFMGIATDDFLFNGNFGVIKSWYDANIPVELHLYQNGGHGFGLGNPNKTSNKWFDSFIYWLEVNSFVTPLNH